MNNQFDHVAPVYDLLSAMVFGNELMVAQCFFLDRLSENDKVLIVGGGTGKILKHPAFVRTSNINFLEISEGMIKRARRYSKSLDDVNFIHADFFQHSGRYDFIICNFFLDCFNEEYLAKACQQLRLMLNPNGRLVVTDFQKTSRVKHRLLLKAMLSFFRLFTALQADKLNDIPKSLMKDFRKINTKQFYKGFVFTSLYQVKTT